MVYSGSHGCVLGGRWIHPEALDSFGWWLGSLRCVLGFVGFNRVGPGCRWVHSVMPLISLRSSGVSPCVHSVSVGSLGCARGVIRVRNGGLWVDHGSLGSLKCTLGVVRFIQGRCFHLCAQRLIQGRCVHLDAPRESLGSSGVVRFTRVRPWRSSGAVRFSHVRPWVCWVHLGIVRFIRGQCFHSCAP